MNIFFSVTQYFIVLFLLLGVQPSSAKSTACDMDGYAVNRLENCPAMRDADLALNKNYKKVLSALSQHNDSKLKLKTTQREWLTWVDTTCNNYVASVGCPNALCFDNAHDECLTVTTKERAGEFVKMLNHIKKNGVRNINFAFSKKSVFAENKK